MTPTSDDRTTVDFPVPDRHRAELDRHLAWFEARMPTRAAKFIGWLRKPSSIFVRVPLALLLVVGGIFSFLPVLGLWMLPLGLVLIAQDVPFLEKPLALFLGWIERKWLARKARKAALDEAALKKAALRKAVQETAPENATLKSDASRSRIAE